MAAVWALAIAVGYGQFTRYTLDAADPRAPARWPSDLPRVEPERSGAVVLFVHPECECTPASAAELARALALVPTPPPVLVTVHTEREIPAADRAAWIAGLPEALRRLPRVRFLPDPLGRLSARFGAETSGEVHVYGPAAEARFRGGVTAARGHEGANVGADRVTRLLTDPAASAEATPVFGCALREDRA